jgi:hypothetical protein
MLQPYEPLQCGHLTIVGSPESSNLLGFTRVDIVRRAELCVVGSATT